MLGRLSSAPIPELFRSTSVLRIRREEPECALRRAVHNTDLDGLATLTLTLGRMAAYGPETRPLPGSSLGSGR